jgi:hypothetical protein
MCTYCTGFTSVFQTLNQLAAAFGNETGGHARGAVNPIWIYSGAAMSPFGASSAATGRAAARTGASRVFSTCVCVVASGRDWRAVTAESAKDY